MMKKYQGVSMTIALIALLIYGANLLLFDGIKNPTAAMTVMGWVTAVCWGIFLILTILRLLTEKK